MLGNWRSAGSGAAACVLAALLLAPAAVAAPPPNDAFADAQPLTGAPVSADGSNTDATLEAGESPPFDASRSVWYTWAAPAAGHYRIETCGSDFDTVLGVYTGSTLAALTLVAANDDGCGLSSRVSINATAGATYRIAVAGFEGEHGNFHLAVAELRPPANDDFSAGQALTGALPLSVSGTTQDAGREADEPFDHGDSSVWYTWTAPAAGAYRVQTCGSATDTVPALYAGNALTSLASRSPYGFASWACSGSPGQSIVVRAAAGESLRIAVGTGDSGTSGPFTLRISAEPAPANDAFATPQRVSGARWELDGLAIAATSEPGEPPHGGLPAARTVWIQWTAPARDRYVLAVDGNVRVGLYTGTSLTALTPVATTGTPQTDGGVWFLATAGTEYRIAVSWSENEPYPTGGRFALAAYDGGLAIAPATLQFPAQTVGTISAPSVVSLRPSPGGLATLPLSISIRGGDAVDFLNAGDDCSSVLPQCAVAVRFAPSATGTRNAVLVVGTFIGAYTVPLAGSGAPASPPPDTPAVPRPAASPAPPVAAGKASCRLTRNTRRGAIVRCTVTRTPTADGTVTGTLLRGKATRAKGSAKLRAGKATLLLKSARRLTSGSYRVSLSIAVRGQRKLTLARTVRVRRPSREVVG